MAETIAAASVVVPGSPGRPTDIRAPAWLTIDAGRVVEIGAGRAPAGATDLGDAVLAPGFVDLQVNGVGRVDFAAATADEWRRAREELLLGGVTSCVPTIVTAPLDAYDPMLVAVDAAAKEPASGARLEGVHLEGPFLGGAPGAHPVELLRPGDPDWLAGLLDRHAGLVRIVTLAPEVDAELACTRLLARRGVRVALGHSTASYELARAAAGAGATIVTHLFNGMEPLHHRDPGLAGAALDDERLTPTLIADLVHVHPAALRLAIARKRDVALVTDAVAVPGAGPEPVHVEGRVARMPDGTIAGSVITMARAVANVVALGLPAERAVELATVVPARVLALDTFAARGIGGRADLVALDPHGLTTRAVWLGGELVRDRG